MSLKQQQTMAMLELQDRVNRAVNPNWLQAGYPFLRAAVVEGAEAMEHHGWKWWKAQTPNIAQLQMELVDIWHFMLSDFIVKSGGHLFDAASAVMMSTHKIGAVEVVHFDGKAYRLEDIDIIGKLELLVGLSVARRTSVPLFESLLDDCGLTWDDLFQQYVPKNVLNIFRQDNGYKEGRYQKTWAGREDNEHLVEIMAFLDPADTDYKGKLLAELQKRYAELTG